MPQPILIVGHKNPDNDSISAAVAYAHLKNQLAKREAGDDEPEFEYVPARLGPLPNESEWVLDQTGFAAPELISHVSVRVEDVMTKEPITIAGSATLLEAGRMLRTRDVRSLVVLDAEGKYEGLVTTRALANRYIAATDKMEGEGADQQAVANDLIASLGQSVSDVLEGESDVLIVNKESLLKDVVNDLMNNALREAVVLDDEGFCIGIMTRSDLMCGYKRKVVLVDHNERTQAVDGIDEAEVVEIVDHHRIGDVSTANPIQFLNMPYGSTATIVATEYIRHDVEITPNVAKVLLSALLTDTVILKSPTTTDVDRRYAETLAEIAGVEVVPFGLELFRARAGQEEIPVGRIVQADSKEFRYGDTVVLIAQHETVDLQSVMDREDEIREYMANLQKAHNYEFVLLMATDIIAEGSNFIVEGNKDAVSKIFGVDCSQAVWMPGVLSRKKQVAAKVLAA